MPTRSRRLNLVLACAVAAFSAAGITGSAALSGDEEVRFCVKM